MTKSRWIVGTLGLLGVVTVATALFGRKVVHTEIEIAAPASEIWAVLSDAERYTEWNPVIIKVAGQYAPGAELSNTVRDGSGQESVMTSKVLRFQPNQELNQFGGLPGLLTFDHQWILEPTATGTRVIQHEEYRGIGIWFWNESWVEPAYSKANEALRERVFELRGP